MITFILKTNSLILKIDTFYYKNVLFNIKSKSFFTL